MPSQPAASAAVRGNFVLLRAGTLALVLPQHEVGEARHRGADAAAGGLVALSSRMTVLPECPADRFVVASIGAGPDRVDWCWSDLRVLIGVELHPVPLPPVVLGPDTPVSAYVEHDGQFGFVCDAARLQAHAFGSGRA